MCRVRTSKLNRHHLSVSLGGKSNLPAARTKFKERSFSSCCRESVKLLRTMKKRTIKKKKTYETHTSLSWTFLCRQDDRQSRLRKLHVLFQVFVYCNFTTFPCNFIFGVFGGQWFYSAFRNFSQTLFGFKKSISGPIELKFSGKTLYAILQPRISSLVGLFLK